MRLFVLLTLLSSIYQHLNGQDNTVVPTTGPGVTEGSPKTSGDVSTAAVTREPVTDDANVGAAGNVTGNRTSGEEGETELPEFWEYKASLMVQAYAGELVQSFLFRH